MREEVSYGGAMSVVILNRKREKGIRKTFPRAGDSKDVRESSGWGGGNNGSPGDGGILIFA